VARFQTGGAPLRALHFVGSLAVSILRLSDCPRAIRKRHGL
jgi:hypothetical protein